jgi:YcxB-like protein
MAVITGIISVADYLAAQRLHRRRAVTLWYGIAVVAAVCGVMWWYFTADRRAFLLLGGGLGGFAGELTMSLIYLPWKVRRLHRQQKDLACTFTYTWDENVLRARSETGQSIRPWKHYLKLKQSKDVLLLYHADNLFEMFPTRWFQDAAEMKEFRSLAANATATR